MTIGIALVRHYQVNMFLV